MLKNAIAQNKMTVSGCQTVCAYRDELLYISGYSEWDFVFCKITISAMLFPNHQQNL